MGIFGLSAREKAIWKAIKKGDSVTVTVGKEQQEKYKTSVCDVNEYFLYIQTPSIDKALLDVAQNTAISIEIEVFNPDNGKIIFESKVMGQEWFKEQRIQIARPRKLSWSQLRRHRRVETGLSAEFCFVEDDQANAGLNLVAPIFVAAVKNISENGALLVVDKLTAVETGAFVNMKLKLADEYVVRCRAKILRIEVSEGKYGLGLIFSKIGEKDRELLRKYIQVNVRRF
jgi:c-di-GMP-binding flagellar brake protein YcgR